MRRWGHPNRAIRAPASSWWLLLVAVLLLGCVSSDEPDGNADLTAEGERPPAAAAIWLALADGSVVSLPLNPDPFSDPDAVATGELILGADVLSRLPPLGERQIAYDGARGRLWYSDDHARIASIDLGTMRAGPMLDAFADIGLWGCAVNGRPRTFAVDAKRDRLLVSSLSGSVLAIDLGTLGLVEAIGPGAFGDPAFDFRHLAVEPASDTLWFTTANGNVGSLSLDTGKRSGGVLAAPSAQAIGVDEASRRLVYLERGGELRSINLDTEAVTAVMSPTTGIASFVWVD